ncbi:MAG: hypothetical protein ACW986_02050 [Promethearchaeota archaeon]|jgi:hypothetical protein
MPNRNEEKAREGEETQEDEEFQKDEVSQEDKPPEDIQRLVVFDHKVISKKKLKNKYAVEKVDQEEKITVKNKLSARGVHYNYSILINNQSPTLILSLRIRVLYSNFLKYSKCFPPTMRVFSPIEQEGEDEKRIDLEFDILKKNTPKKIRLLFTSSTIEGRGEFKILIAYEKSNGEIKVIKSDPIEIQIEKLNISPKIISSSSIRDFSQQRDVKRNLISIGFGTNKKGNFDKYLEVLEQLFLSNNFQLIVKEKVRGTVWFFGTENQSGSDILVLGKVFSNRIEIMAFSENPVTLVSVLSFLSKNLKEVLLSRKLVKSEKWIIDLDCINCGTFLPFFPKKGESIECEKCQYKQIVW